MKNPLFILAAICLVAFAVVAILSDRVFERVPHSEDEVAYIFQARVFAQNRLAVPTPAYAAAFWSPFVVDYQGQRFGKYSPGWPWLLSLGVRLGTPWLVNALLGAATLALVAWLGNCFYVSSQYVGLLAAALGLVTPGFLFLSASLLSHPASMFWSTLALVALFYTSRQTFNLQPVTFNALLTGLCLGAAFVTRPFAGIGIGLAAGIFLLILILRREIHWAALFWLGLGWLTMAAWLPLYWWAVTGDPTFNAYLLVWPYDRVGFGPDIGPYGYGWREAIFINTRLKLEALATGLFGWPGWLSLLFLFIPFLARQANRWDWLLLGTLVSVIFVHVFYWSFGGTDGGFPRYYYDALPALLLLTARGILILGEILAYRPARFNKPGRSNWRYWLPLGLVLILVAYNLGWNLPTLLAAQKGKYGITAAQLRAVEQANLPQPALVIVKNVGRWSDFAAPFAANSPTLDGPIIYTSDQGPDITRKLREQFRERGCWELDGISLNPCR